MCVLRKRGQGFGILVSKIPKDTNASYSLQEPSEEHGRYVPLDSDVTVKLHTKPEPITLDSELKCRMKRKRNGNTMGKKGQNRTCPLCAVKRITIASNIPSSPQNYRYQKYIDGYDEEEDEIKLEESDFYYDDNYDSYEELDDDSSKDARIKLWSNNAQMARGRNSSHMPFHHVSNKEVQRLESNFHTRDGSAQSSRKYQEIPFTDPHYVLKSMTNFTTASQPTVQKIAVDASLSNWLVS
ncbi:uncharacterized protein LOC111401528 [Olea europaea subsp. europaea]|uniref:Uncharacterized protein LOC111401528 n=1 Tax=Olea europaea subsp. europaea TaxID=158383 RepID=A0A8S0SR69_OLEEU|nr:uncharacterized protein LOC111401528 [Olea europaea subsp. europaea]